jgi:hypothetical protein
MVEHQIAVGHQPVQFAGIDVNRCPFHISNACVLTLHLQIPLALRWRSVADPGGGCDRRPSAPTYLYLYAVGAGDHVALPCLAR